MDSRVRGNDGSGYWLLLFPPTQSFRPQRSGEPESIASAGVWTPFFAEMMVYGSGSYSMAADSAASGAVFGNIGRMGMGGASGMVISPRLDSIVAS